MQATIIGSWSDVTLCDLFYAFRKAKADNFFEKSLRLTEAFIEYESDLATNLQALQSRLASGEIRHLLLENLGTPIIFPKGLGTSNQSDPDVQHAHGFFSDTQREFDRLIQEEVLKPEFRLIGDFPVVAHVLSALWINLVGHKFDEQLSENALGSRLRRYRRGNGAAIGAYHREAIGSFEPYFRPYRRWRDEGLAIAREQLSADASVIAVTLDFSNFYHRIDPSFLASPDFRASIGIQLTDFEVDFTSAFSEALVSWGEHVRDYLTVFGCDREAIKSGGLPIGLSIVRVMSNAILTELDRAIERELSPLYYARYVDDIFLVLQDPGSLKSTSDLWKHLSQRVRMIDVSENRVRVKLPDYSGTTDLSFHIQKQKCFFLSGRGGLDLLTHVASEIRNVASERRLMPAPDQLERSAAARVLTAAETTTDEADSLRRADGLSVKRLGWSILLRSVEILARDLRPKDWQPERRRFYQFAEDHIVRPDRILTQIDYLPRLMSLAVTMGDWADAHALFKNTLHAISVLEQKTSNYRTEINGYGAPNSTAIWPKVRDRVIHAYREAVIRAFPIEETNFSSRYGLRLLKQLDLVGKDLASLALQAREFDWARMPYKEHIRLHASRWRPRTSNEEALHGCYLFGDDLKEFLRISGVKGSPMSHPRLNDRLSSNEELTHSLLSYLIPTRPYTPEEIAMYLPDECVFAEPVEAAHNWAVYTRAVRGVWVRSQLADEHDANDSWTMPADNGGDSSNAPPSRMAEPPDPPFAMIGDATEKPIYLCITSLGTSDETWNRGASGKRDLSSARYARLGKLINDIINATPRTPTHVVLPELSVPDEWVATISHLLAQSGISLIAGLDYQTYPDKKINSSAVLVLTDDRLGYPSTVQIRQIKEAPAPDEGRELKRRHDRDWLGNIQNVKPVYIHDGFFFGVLVCSELQNVTYRLAFQGYVDCLMTLSWNRDLETFGALVDASSLDIHAYIALVNNRSFGDSRVRAPAKMNYDRDKCRIRGGLNDHFVIVKIDPTELRAQQSRELNWTTEHDKYKPVPEGFRPWKRRKILPS